MNRFRLAASCAALLPSTWLAPALAADIESAGMFRAIGFQQTGEGEVAEAYAFITVGVKGTGATSFNAAELVTPTAMAAPMPSTSGLWTDFEYRSPDLGNLASLNAALPSGTYDIILSDDLGALAQTSIAYGADNYAAIPLLTNGSFTALQGMNASQAITLSVSTLDADGADLALVFFDVWRRSDGANVLSNGFLPATTASIQVAAGVLVTGTDYLFTLDHSRRSFQATAGNSTVFANFLAFETATFGHFSTAPVPEPGTYGLMALGLVCLAGTARRRR